MKGITNRSRKGSMLALSLVLIGVITVILLAGLSIGSLYCVQSKLQNMVDELALEGATKVNENNRVGQMNCMVAHSRQSVFASRLSYDCAKEKFPHMQDLAYELLEESRQGAMLVEDERESLRKLINQEVYLRIVTRFDQLSNKSDIVLPTIAISKPEFDTISIGEVIDVSTNVKEPQGFCELDAIDLHEKLIQSKSHFYQPNINAKLSNDTDLNFLICSLPPIVDGVHARPRLLNNSDYRYIKTHQLRSAVQVSLRARVDAILGIHQNSRLYARSAAAASGSSIEP